MTANELYINYLKDFKLQVPIAKLDIDTQRKYRERVEQTAGYKMYAVDKTIESIVSDARKCIDKIIK